MHKLNLLASLAGPDNLPYGTPHDCCWWCHRWWNQRAMAPQIFRLMVLAPPDFIQLVMVVVFFSFKRYSIALKAKYQTYKRSKAR